MGVLDDLIEQVAGADGAPDLAVARIDEVEVGVVLDRLNERVGDADAGAVLIEDGEVAA